MLVRYSRLFCHLGLTPSFITARAGDTRLSRADKKFAPSVHATVLLATSEASYPIFWPPYAARIPDDFLVLIVGFPASMVAENPTITLSAKLKASVTRIATMLMYLNVKHLGLYWDGFQDYVPYIRPKNQNQRLRCEIPPVD
jgi:hypothetical protein